VLPKVAVIPVLYVATDPSVAQLYWNSAEPLTTSLTASVIVQLLHVAPPLIEIGPLTLSVPVAP
jgi:hypothetical protein